MVAWNTHQFQLQLAHVVISLVILEPHLSLITVRPDEHTHYVQQDDNPRGHSSSLSLFFPSQSLANKSLLQHREYLRTRWYLASVPWRSMKSELPTFLAIRWASSRVTSRSIRWKSSLFCSAIRVRIEDEDKYTARDERRGRKWKRGDERGRVLERQGRRPACGTMHSRTFERLYASARPRGQV